MLGIVANGDAVGEPQLDAGDLGTGVIDPPAGVEAVRPATSTETDPRIDLRGVPPAPPAPPNTRQPPPGSGSTGYTQSKLIIRGPSRGCVPSNVTKYTCRRSDWRCLTNRMSRDRPALRPIGSRPDSCRPAPTRRPDLRASRGAPAQILAQPSRSVQHSSRLITNSFESDDCIAVAAVWRGRPRQLLPADSGHEIRADRVAGIHAKRPRLLCGCQTRRAPPRAALKLPQWTRRGSAPDGDACAVASIGFVAKLWRRRRRPTNALRAER